MPIENGFADGCYFYGSDAGAHEHNKMLKREHYGFIFHDFHQTRQAFRPRAYHTEIPGARSHGFTYGVHRRHPSGMLLEIALSRRSPTFLDEVGM